MLISIVISIYNGEQYILRCVESFYNQTYKNLELILVDDASTDNTKEILYSIQKNSNMYIKVLSCKKNNGPGGGKNEGMQLAEGEYIFFCDCDDFITNNFIAELVDNAKENNYPDIVLAGFEKVDEQGHNLYTRRYNNEKQALYQAIANWGKLFKLSYLRNNNLQIPYGKVLDDVMFRAVIICTNPKISLCQSIGYKYTLNKMSVSQTYMKSFIEGVMENEISYLRKEQIKINTKYNDLYIYFVYVVLCWHILKSGSGVGTKQMRIEYMKMKRNLKEYFPEYVYNPYLKGRQPFNMRMCLKIAIKTIYLFDKIGCALPFLLIYSSIDLSKIWPKM